MVLIQPQKVLLIVHIVLTALVVMTHLQLSALVELTLDMDKVHVLPVLQALIIPLMVCLLVKHVLSEVLVTQHML